MQNHLIINLHTLFLARKKNHKTINLKPEISRHDLLALEPGSCNNEVFCTVILLMMFLTITYKRTCSRKSCMSWGNSANMKLLMVIQRLLPFTDNKMRVLHKAVKCSFTNFNTSTLSSCCHPISVRYFYSSGTVDCTVKFLPCIRLLFRGATGATLRWIDCRSDPRLC